MDIGKNLEPLEARNTPIGVYGDGELTYPFLDEQVMFYPVMEDPYSLVERYSLQGLTPIDRKSPTDWARIFFAHDEHETEYVVRLSSMGTTSNLERNLEHAISVKLSDHGIGPHIYESFPDEGVLLMERLQPAVFDPGDVSQIEKLSKLIACLHSIDISDLPEIPVVAHKYSAAYERLEALFEDAADRFPQHNEAFSAWHQLRDRLEGDTPSAVLCHNDVHIRNLLMGNEGSLAIIDNDHCSLGSGLYDLVSSVISFKLPADTERHFLRSYGADVNAEKFLEYKKLYYLTYACMVFSFIQDYDRIDTSQVMDIDPSGAFGRLPPEMGRDMRLYTQSSSFLRALGNL